MNEARRIIEWPESMRTGIDSIDEQHHMLASMVQFAQSRLSENSSRTEVEAVILDLMNYALYHFDTEEELMLIHDYHLNEREKHCKEHRRFSAAIAQYQQDIRLGKLVSSDELFGFIREWLTIHILNTDKKLGEFLFHINQSNS